MKLLRATIVTLTLGLAFTLTACNTIRGMGQDVEGAGERVQDTATDVQQEIK